MSERMATKTKIVWREFYDAETVEKLTAMGTLPRNETEIDAHFEDGPGVARLIAETVFNSDSESFRNGGDLTILEPAAFAGDYTVTVDFEPTFYAYSK